jgi:hypothetical protein
MIAVGLAWGSRVWVWRGFQQIGWNRWEKGSFGLLKQVCAKSNAKDEKPNKQSPNGKYRNITIIVL